MFSRYVGIDQSLKRLVLKRYRSFRCINIQRAAIKAADFFAIRMQATVLPCKVLEINYV